MKVLVFGAGGMLGHQLCRTLSNRMEISGTFRKEASHYEPYKLLRDDHAFSGIDAENLDCIGTILRRIQPDAVINAVGVVKQRNEAKTAVISIRINALFPHQLAQLCERTGTRVIHISTDCVFSGVRGNYSETDFPDATDLYGRTKLLGELASPHCLTLRTSIIGWEIENRAALLEWFAGQRGQRIKGYHRAIYSGLPTSVLANLIGDLLELRPDLSGLYHVASRPISKYDLLVKLGAALRWNDIMIDQDEEFFCDRSLNGTLFQRKTGWQAPSWDDMIRILASEWPFYQTFRKESGPIL